MALTYPPNKFRRILAERKKPWAFPKVRRNIGAAVLNLGVNTKFYSPFPATLNGDKWALAFLRVYGSVTGGVDSLNYYTLTVWHGSEAIATLTIDSTGTVDLTAVDYDGVFDKTKKGQLLEPTAGVIITIEATGTPTSTADLTVIWEGVQVADPTW